MTLPELEEAIQALVQETAKLDLLPCDRDNTCLNKLKHYGTPFDKAANNLCPACSVCYHAAMMRNALISFIRSR